MTLIDQADGLGNMKPRQIFSILLGIVVLSIVAIFGFLVLQSQVFTGFSEYEMAKQKWSNRTFSKYRLTVNSINYDMTSCIYDVEVQDEKVLLTYPTDTCSNLLPKYTISGLFDWIMEYKTPTTVNTSCLGVVRLISDYDMSLGYPYSIIPQISSEPNWLSFNYWMDQLIGQRHCYDLANSYFIMAYKGFEVKLLQPLP